eukprot:g12989.t1
MTSLRSFTMAGLSLVDSNCSVSLCEVFLPFLPQLVLLGHPLKFRVDPGLILPTFRSAFVALHHLVTYPIFVTIISSPREYLIPSSPPLFSYHYRELCKGLRLVIPHLLLRLMVRCSSWPASAWAHRVRVEAIVLVLVFRFFLHPIPITD